METKVKWWVVYFIVAIFVLSVYVDHCLQRVVRMEKGLQKVEFQLHYYLPDLPENCTVCHVPGKKKEEPWKLKRTER